MRCARFPSLPLVPARALSIPAAALAAVLAALLLPGCDLFGSDEDDPGVEGVPPKHLVAMTAVYDEKNENGSHVQRLVVADFENPERYDVLHEAGTHAARPCFGPDKRRLIFEDHENGGAGSGGRIALMDLDSGETERLEIDAGRDGVPLAGSLKGCVWKPDGSGFYVTVSTGAGLVVFAISYDLESRTTETFARRPGAYTTIVYGRKGRDSILVLSAAGEDHDREHIPFYFVDTRTGEYVEQIQNEHLRFVPRAEEPETGGWDHGAFRPAYNDDEDLIVFQLGDLRLEETLAVTNLDGSLLRLLNTSNSFVYSTPRWGPKNKVLLNRRPRKTHDYDKEHVMVADTETGEVREFVKPGTIDGAVGLRTPDY